MECSYYFNRWKNFGLNRKETLAQKTDVEALARKLFPMFDFDGLIASITPDVLTFEGSYMQVQFSDGWDNEFYCSAYAEFDENMVGMLISFCYYEHPLSFKFKLQEKWFST